MKNIISVIFFASLLLGCTYTVEGDAQTTTPPIGYVFHCKDYPDSVFCNDSE